MKRSSLLLGATALGLTLLLPACGGGGGSASGSGKTTVVATTTMLADATSQIAGDDLEVKGLMGAGVDPHQYQATPSDAAALRKADGIIYNGLLLEGTMAENLDGLSEDRDTVLAIATLFGKNELLEPAEEAHADPHLWGSAELWSRVPGKIGALLSQLDPANAEGYAERAEALEARYTELHEWALERVATIPKEKRILFTSHDAFGYFGKAYGFEVYGVQGISTDSEPGAQDIAAGIALIKEKGVPAIFIESSVSPKVIERISKDAGVEIAGKLFSDATGPAGEKATIGGKEVDLGTYEGMFMYNVETIVRALGGK